MIYRTCRGFHLLPKVYEGLPGVTTNLVVWLWWAWEVKRNAVR